MSSEADPPIPYPSPQFSPDWTFPQVILPCPSGLSTLLLGADCADSKTNFEPRGEHDAKHSSKRD